MRLQEIKDKFDLSKSDYEINKNVFRVVLALIGVLAITIISIDGFGVMFGSFGFSCDEVGGCNNPYYSDLCVEDYCQDRIIENGVRVGDPEPSDLAQNFGFIVLLLLLAAFLFNHLKYNKDYTTKGDLKDERI